jgi:hypothetical protein
MYRWSGLALAACVLWASAARGQPAQVILIRHAEKPPEGHDLSLKGRERAAALAPFFLGAPEVLTYKTPAAIYAQAVTKEDRSRRPIETVTPLAKALMLDLITRYGHSDYPQMAKDVLANPDYKGKMVLICWEHKVIPDMAKAFGVKDAPAKWHGETFDRLWVITFNADGTTTFRDLPQRLLFGDSPR